jgi:hypothetical protein
MEYTGSISDEERQVHQAQSYGWPLNRGKQWFHYTIVVHHFSVSNLFYFFLVLFVNFIFVSIFIV